MKNIRNFVVAATVGIIALFTGAVGCATTGATGSGLDVANLQDLRGEPASLAETVRTSRATVLVWWSATCPCVKRYSDRIRALYERFAPEGVSFVAIASNADDGPDVVAAAVADGQIPFTALLDPGASLADHFGVVSTPSVLVLDSAGAVRFRGWVDNERQPGQGGREAWLEDQLTQMLAGSTKTKRTPAWGCIITRSLGGMGSCGKKSGGHE